MRSGARAPSSPVPHHPARWAIEDEAVQAERESGVKLKPSGVKPTQGILGKRASRVQTTGFSRSASCMSVRSAIRSCRKSRASRRSSA